MFLDKKDIPCDASCVCMSIYLSICAQKILTHATYMPVKIFNNHNYNMDSDKFQPIHNVEYTLNDESLWQNNDREFEYFSVVLVFFKQHI